MLLKFLMKICCKKTERYWGKCESPDFQNMHKVYNSSILPISAHAHTFTTYQSTPAFKYTTLFTWEQNALQRIKQFVYFGMCALMSSNTQVLQIIWQTCLPYFLKIQLHKSCKSMGIEKSGYDYNPHKSRREIRTFEFHQTGNYKIQAIPISHPKTAHTWFP